MIIVNCSVCELTAINLRQTVEIMRIKNFRWNLVSKSNAVIRTEETATQHLTSVVEYSV